MGNDNRQGMSDRERQWGSAAVRFRTIAALLVLSPWVCYAAIAAARSRNAS